MLAVDWPWADTLGTGEIGKLAAARIASMRAETTTDACFTSAPLATDGAAGP